MRSDFKFVFTTFLLVIFLAGCIPTAQFVPTYTFDSNLLLTLNAIKNTPTSHGSVLSTGENAKSITVTKTATSRSVALTNESIRLSATATSTSTKTKVPTVTRKPTSTRKPTRTKIPSKTPTKAGPTATPAPQDAPIRIFSPASLSRVVSPIHLVMSVVPGSKGNVFLQLTGEDGEIIYDRKWTFSYANGRRTTVDEEIEFSLDVLSESAHLKVFTFDEYGRMVNFASEDILLLSVGKNDLAEAEYLTEPFALFRPYPDQLIKNDRIIISGMTRCRIDCRLVFEVVDTSGKQLLLDEQQKIIQASRDYQPIWYELPIKVNSPTWVRLILHQQDVFTAEDIAVSSVLIKLLP